jgi:hypothetical protein
MTWWFLDSCVTSVTENSHCENFRGNRLIDWREVVEAYRSRLAHQWGGCQFPEEDRQRYASLRCALPVPACV